MPLALGALGLMLAAANVYFRDIQHLLDKTNLAELACTDIDRQGQFAGYGIAGPAHQLLTGRLQHPLPQRQDEAGLLRQRNKIGGRLESERSLMIKSL